MWTPVYQDPDEISYIHAGPTALNKLRGYFSIRRRSRHLSRQSKHTILPLIYGIAKRVPLGHSLSYEQKVGKGPLQ